MKRILPLILCVVLLASCSGKVDENQKHERTLFSMDTQIDMRVYGENGEEALDKAEEEIKRINEKYGITTLDKTVLSPDEETKSLLLRAQEIKESTNGTFDISVAPIMRIWGFYSSEFGKKSHRVPSNDEIAEALSAAEQGIYLDLGAMAKGYCADKVVEILKDEGIESAVISLGGNVAVVGNNTDGNPWTVGIQSPFDESIYATVKASDKMIVTSGNYMRYFEENGRRYHHIINPETGYPADNDLTSVTVIADNGAYADAISTALFVMGKDKAIEYWKSDKGFEMILITKDGKIYCTDGVDIQTENELSIIKEQ